MSAILLVSCLAVVCFVVLYTVKQEVVGAVGATMALALILVFGNPSVPGLVVMSTFGGVLAISACVWLRRGGIQPVTLGLTLVLILGSLSLTILVSFATGFEGLAFHFVVLVGFAGFAVLCGLLSKRDQQLFRKAVIALGVLLVIMAVGESADLVDPLWGFRNEFERINPLLGGEISRAQGTLGHPIPLAVFLAVALLLVLQGHAEVAIPAKLFLISILTAGIVLTGTRSVIIALVLAVLFWICVDRRKGMAGRMFAFIALVAGGLIFFLSEVEGLTADLVNSGSYLNRLGVLESIPALLQQDTAAAVFGSGLSGELHLFQQGVLTKGSLQVVDNQFISTYIQAGIAGAGLLVIGLLIGILQSGTDGKVPLVFLAAMCLVFDMFSWYSCVFLLIWVCCISYDRDSALHSNVLESSARSNLGVR